MKAQHAFDLIYAELTAAERKHPGWPSDPIHGVAIMVEEAGESMKAALDLAWKNGSLDDLKKELAQTGAMALRNLLNLPDEEDRPDEIEALR